MVTYSLDQTSIHKSSNNVVNSHIHISLILILILFRLLMSLRPAVGINPILLIHPLSLVRMYCALEASQQIIGGAGQQ